MVVGPLHRTTYVGSKPGLINCAYRSQWARARFDYNDIDPRVTVRAPLPEPGVFVKSAAKFTACSPSQRRFRGDIDRPSETTTRSPASVVLLKQLFNVGMRMGSKRAKYYPILGLCMRLMDCVLPAMSHEHIKTNIIHANRTRAAAATFFSSKSMI